MTQALLIVDVQRDFCPGGSLPVPGGDRVVPVLNRYIRLAAQAGLPLVACRDWHPPKTRHFAPYGGAWPVHCVEHTPGAAFHPDLALAAGAGIVSKGMDPDQDSYSCFDGTLEGIAFERWLRGRGISGLIIGGLATDYCVKATVIDAAKRGFAVTVLTDAIAGVDVTSGDVERALAQMRGVARFVEGEQAPGVFLRGRRSRAVR
ncbi:MAG: nicotinamidase [Candidatus Omnitrophica bacterium]|nr:nicotinamidase [Candidatus Omnitrophota bacterium]